MDSKAFDGILSDLKNQVSKEVLKTLNNNKDFLLKLSINEFTDLMKYCTPNTTDYFDKTVYLYMMRTLSDKDFLELRRETINALKQWADLNAKKDKIVKELISNITQVTASIIIKACLLRIEKGISK